MKNLVRNFALASMLAFGWASLAHSAPCSSGTLSSYIALGASGCEIDSASFRNFASLDTSFGAIPIDPSDVLVIALTDDPFRPGLSFQLDQSAAANELLEILIAYEVVAPTIRGIELAIEGSSVTEDGANTAIEDICLGGNFDPNGPTGCTGTSDVLIVFDIGIDAELMASLGFADVTALAVIKDIAIDGGPEGAASLDRATNRFLVPEPSTALLVVAGLAIFARRNRPT